MFYWVKSPETATGTFCSPAWNALFSNSKTVEVLLEVNKYEEAYVGGPCWISLALNKYNAWVQIPKQLNLNSGKKGLKQDFQHKPALLLASAWNNLDGFLHCWQREKTVHSDLWCYSLAGEEWEEWGAVDRSCSAWLTVSPSLWAKLSVVNARRGQTYYCSLTGGGLQRTVKCAHSWQHFNRKDVRN